MAGDARRSQSWLNCASQGLQPGRRRPVNLNDIVARMSWGGETACR
jgi:hypothetical protein